MAQSGQTPTRAEGPSWKQTIIAASTLLAIGLHLLLRYGLGVGGTVHGVPLYQLPLILALVLGGGPLVIDLLGKLVRAEFGSDLLAGISIVTSAVLGTLNGAAGS